MSYRIRKDDLVQVICGDEKGQTGKVLAVKPKEDRVLVEGVNIVKRHSKADGRRNIQAGIIEKEAYIHISNVMIVDKKVNKPTRIGVSFLADGKKVRMSKKSKEQLD
ncbi:MAG: 50S ribosomal protein L24 [Chitinispirillales bacterium]|jgi:large subunit ribosomal protein L24|nr:50S ribosomal protein L24 [Chitinispirillales bacterium]